MCLLDSVADGVEQAAHTMERVCFRLQVKVDRLDEYIERHAEVWPEMLAALRETGWTNYSLFVDHRRRDTDRIPRDAGPRGSEGTEWLDIPSTRDGRRRWQSSSPISRTATRRRLHAASPDLPPRMMDRHDSEDSAVMVTDMVEPDRSRNRRRPAGEVPSSRQRSAQHQLRRRQRVREGRCARPCDRQRSPRRCTSRAPAATSAR